MKRNQKGFTSFELLVAIAIIAIAIGWVMNIIALIHAGSLSTLTVLLVLRIIGIFIPPLGAILGYFA